MKIAIGMKPRKDAYGGGNQFCKMLSSYLVDKGISVVYDLADRDIDIILIIDPRPHSEVGSFSIFDVLSYIKKVKKDTLIVHRVNECDERKKTTTVNSQLSLAGSISDHAVYISSWLARLFNGGSAISDSYSVIKNGADNKIFIYNKKHTGQTGKFKMVTHHWSPNVMKGWDIYYKLDSLLDKEEYRKKIEFHYIGNHPAGIKTHNIIFHEPCTAGELVSLLGSCHIYVTASKNEPAGMHHIEGALCGLPVLYRNSGALPEYCGGFGVVFNGIEDLESSLKEITDNYDLYRSRMSGYNLTGEQMCNEYFSLFINLLSRKDAICTAERSARFNSFNSAKLRLLYFYYKVLNKGGIL